ncbi:MAG TPA: glutathione S-transferase family protein [Polyangiaceae bacterium]|jgi:glutathione S-transferase|nr:glutathione S-transferase family protein [Polyangiaceae bacterium]
MSNSSLKIYGVPFSVHTRKVILAARIKSMAFELVPVVPVIPDKTPANWRSISPTGFIPAIEDDGFVLAESSAILLYLERKQPMPALLPANARDYGRALFFDAWASTALFRQIVHPLFHNQIVAPNLRKQPGDPSAIDLALNQAAPEAFAFLEQSVSGKHLVGDVLTIADLTVVSNLIMFHYLGRRIDGARFPKLRAYFERSLGAEPFAHALAHEKQFVEGVPGLKASCVD